MRQDKDYYRVLQVPRDASQEDIKRAYRRLAREFHPDVNPGDKRAEERLKEINEAYAVLGDPEARQQYDRARTRVRIRRGEPRANRQPSPWADLFEIFFGEEPRHHRRPTRAEAPRGRTYEAHVTLDFEEAFRGKEVTLTVEGRRVRVAIPPGARDGMSLRVRGAGGQSPYGGLAGDLVIRVRVRPHPQFRVEGLDIGVDVEVDLFTALLGGTVRVPTPEGDIGVRVPPGTQPGAIIRVPGRGLPDPEHPGEWGDLLVRVGVTLPTPLSDAERALLEEWQRLRQQKPGR